MVQRVISGVVLRETDPLQTPLRKMSGSGFASIMVAVVALAGTGLVGIFFPSGNSTWQNKDAVIVEAETGALFAYLDLSDNNTDDKILYPVSNYTSAALIVETTDVLRVSRASLLGVTRGPELGILDAPASPPDPELMLDGPWTLCSLAAETESGGSTPNTALVVGLGPSRGTAIEDKGVLVHDLDLDTSHLVYAGYQYPIPNEFKSTVLEALFLQSVPAVEVGTAWLNALPAGRDLRPIPVPGLGAVSSVLSDAIVGEVRVVEGADKQQFYLVATETVVEITALQAGILLADPGIRDTVYRARGLAPEAIPLQSGLVSDALRVDLAEPLATDPPAEIPDHVETTVQNETGQAPTICASFGADQGIPEISVEAAVEGVQDANVTQQTTPSGTVLADLVFVEPGHGTIVEALASPTASSGTLYLVTDKGRRYPLPSADVQTKLGYGGFTPVRLPVSLVERVPLGPALDRRAALAPVG